MTADPKRDVERRLSELLARVIDWLKFAEAKNTGAVGLSSTGLGVIVTFLVAGPPIPDPGGGRSRDRRRHPDGQSHAGRRLVPALDQPGETPDRRARKTTTRDNLLFYGHLARYEPSALTRAIAENYFDHDGETYVPSKLAIDSPAQIVTNARITVRKLALFTYLAPVRVRRVGRLGGHRSSVVPG